MGLKRTEEFRRDAVRIALTSGLRRRVAAAAKPDRAETSHIAALAGFAVIGGVGTWELRLL